MTGTRIRMMDALLFAKSSLDTHAHKPLANAFLTAQMERFLDWKNVTMETL